MKGRLLAFALAAGLSGSNLSARPVAAEEQPQARNILRSGWTYLALPGAPDHRAVYAAHDRAPPNTRTNVIRAGDWHRETSDIRHRGRTTLVETTTGTTYLYSGNGDPDRQNLIISGPDASTQTLVATGQRHSILGEVCTIWTVTHSYGQERLCITDDGLLLLQELIDRSGASRRMQAVSLERGPQDIASIRAPDAILNPASWFGAALGAAGAGDAVVFGESHSQDLSRALFLRFGLIESLETREPGGGTRLQITAPNVHLSIERRADGRLVRLDARRAAGSGRPRTDALSGWRAMVPARHRVIAGTPCTVYEATHPPVGGGKQECRANDGLLLERRLWGEWGFSQHIRATEVRRGTVRREDILPHDLFANGGPRIH